MPVTRASNIFIFFSKKIRLDLDISSESFARADNLYKMSNLICLDLIMLGFNDTSTLVGHFVSSPRERKKRDRRDSKGDEREGQGIKRKINVNEETEEIKTFPLYPYLLQG